MEDPNGAKTATTGDKENVVPGATGTGSEGLRLRVERHVKGQVHEDWWSGRVHVVEGVPGERLEVASKDRKKRVIACRYRLQGWDELVRRPLPARGKVGRGVLLLHGIVVGEYGSG